MTVPAMKAMTNRERRQAKADQGAMIHIQGFDPFREDDYSIDACDEGRGAIVEIGVGWEFIVFPSREDAGADARDYYAEMAKDDPGEFRHMVGDAALVAWALGQPGGPGSTKVSSLNEWLSLFADAPEEHHAAYDGEGRRVLACSKALALELGFVPRVAYRRG